MQTFRFLRVLFLMLVLFASPACAADVRADVSLGTALSAAKGSTISVPVYVKAPEGVAVDGLSLQAGADPNSASTYGRMREICMFTHARSRPHPSRIEGLGCR